MVRFAWPALWHGGSSPAQFDRGFASTSANVASAAQEPPEPPLVDALPVVALVLGAPVDDALLDAPPEAPDPPAPPPDPQAESAAARIVALASRRWTPFICSIRRSLRVAREINRTKDGAAP
jgi:hypothetical protein